MVFNQRIVRSIAGLFLSCLVAVQGFAAGQHWEARYLDMLKAREESRFADAQKIAEELLVDLGDDETLYRDERSSVLTQIGRIKADQGQYAEAQPFFSQALALVESVRGVKSRDYVYAAMDVAGNHVNLGQFAEAEAIYLKLLKLNDGNKGVYAPELSTPHRALASLYFRQGRLLESEKLLLQTLKSASVEALGVKFDVSPYVWQSLGAIHVARGNVKEAIALHRKALDVLDDELSESREKWGTPGNGTLARSIECLERLEKLSGMVKREKDAGRYAAQAAALRAEMGGEPLSTPMSWGQGVFPLP